MKLTKQFLIGAGGMAIAVLALTLLVPRAAHAVAAALVNVANTAAAPAVVEDVSKLQSENILLSIANGVQFNPHTSQSLYQISPNGVMAPSPFIVPAGETFVTTTVDLTPGSSGLMFVGIGPEEVEFEQSGIFNTVQYHFPNGIVFPAGSSVTFSNYGASAGPLSYVYVHGYLTAN